MSIKFSFFSSRIATGLLLLLVSFEAFAVNSSPSRVPSRRTAEAGTGGLFRKSLNRYQEAQIRNFLDQSSEFAVSSSLDTLNLIVFQVQFADSLMGGQVGSRRPEVRDSLYFANELQHLTDYFKGASRNHLTIFWEIVSGLYTLPEGMGYYGKDGEEERRVVEMAQTIIDSADGEVDFSLYDSMVMIHAGAGQETDLLDDSRNQIWSSFYDQDDIDSAFPDSTVSGLVTNDSLGGAPFFVDNFLVLPANSSQDGNIIGTLGIYAYSVGSRLGLVPLFDSRPEGRVDSRGVGSFCLMSHGLFNALGFIPAFPCAFNRLLAGWIDPVFVTDAGHFRLQDVNSSIAGDTACLKVPITEGEYFLVVNRVHDTNFDSLFTFTDFDSNLVPDNTDSLGGAEFDFFLTDVTNPQVIKPDPDFGGMLRRYVSTGSGIYIWHIDETVIRQAVETGFLPNDFVSRKGVDLEEADGVQDLDGVADSDFSFGSYWDSYRSGHMSRFAPDTKPSSRANSGARTGLIVSNITRPGPFMECDVAFSLPYEENRIRWKALSSGQPPTPVNLDGGDSTEVVVLADTGEVYVFRADGREYIDWDTDPETIEPFISAPGAIWTGPPAFGTLDCNEDVEIVASSVDGRLFAWKPDGTEFFDGDNDPLTQGVLYSGFPMAAPPMLFDIDWIVCSEDEIAIVERLADSLVVSFINDTGNYVIPAVYSSYWPIRIQAQFASTPAFASYAHTEGLVVAWLDTVESVYGISYAALRPVPMTQQSESSRQQIDDAAWSVTYPYTGGANIIEPFLSQTAVGDLDADGSDEIVLTLPENRLVIYSRSAINDPLRTPFVFFELWGTHPSAPALGDVDLDGTLEIALSDNEYFYLFKHNGALYTDWPKKRQSIEYFDLPPLSFTRLGKSPLICDINGDEKVEILFPESEGAVRAFRFNAAETEGFPRSAPMELSATPSIFDLDGDGELSLIIIGSTAAFYGRDGVADSLFTEDLTTLSIQQLPGSHVSVTRPWIRFWIMHQGNLERWGRTETFVILRRESGLVEEGSFIIYPNPVTGGEVHARIILNRSAGVGIEIYNLEGERAISLEHTGNPGDVLQTPFDKVIDVSGLKSGVYFLRLHIEGAGGAADFVKPFAIKR